MKFSLKNLRTYLSSGLLAAMAVWQAHDGNTKMALQTAATAFAFAFLRAAIGNEAGTTQQLIVTKRNGGRPRKDGGPAGASGE